MASLRFFPHELLERKFNGKILLTSLKIGTDEKVNEIVDESKISIPYDNRNLTIEVALTDYYKPQGNNFFYRLDNDSTWVRIGNQNSLHLSQLPAGDHSIQILGKNLNDQQSLNTLTLNINVQQVFYKQAWFIALVLLTLIVVSWSFFKLKLNQLMEVQRLRTKIASDLHDEVGSMLTRISILTEVLKIKNKNHSEVEHIALASRQATSTMSDVLWSVDARNDKVENLVDRMRDHADSLLHPKNIDINFKIEGDGTKELNMQTRQNLLLIFKEAINNIARHSNATRVEIGLKAGKNELSVMIKDNGSIAPPKNGKGSGQGLKNMQMRAKEINASLTFQNGDGFSVILQKKV
ncbi:MAG: ATP-binding protein [Bacteroidota bacterium]